MSNSFFKRSGFCFLLFFYTFTVESQEASVSDRLDKLERTLSTAGLIDLVEQIEALQKEVQDQRGKIETLQFKIKKISDDEGPLGITSPEELAAKLVDEPAAISLNEEPAPVQEVMPLPGSSETIQNGSQSTSVITGEKLYRSAFGLLKSGKYLEAIEGFNFYLSENPQGKYSDNSQYWMGEAYYVLQDYLEAIKQYRKLIQKFPDSKKSSHALLKIGYSHEKLGNKNEALKILSELQENFPNSAAARLGLTKIEKLRAE